MALQLFAEIHVRDFAAAVPWYETLFGAPASFQAHDTEVVWELAEHRSVALEGSPDKAGYSEVTIFVDDYDERVAAIRERGIEPALVETYGNGVRKATFRDPEGNEFGIGGPPA